MAGGEHSPTPTPPLGERPASSASPRPGSTAKVLSDALGTTAPPSRLTARAAREREIEFAEFETRIRKFILELLEPTIRRTTQLENDMQNYDAEFSRTTTMLSNCMEKSHKAEQQIQVVEHFREELARWDAERRQAEAKVAEDMAGVKQELDMFRSSLERKESTIHGMQRTTDRLTQELSKVQQAAEELRMHVEKRMGQQSKILNGAKTDMEVKLIALETHFNRLSDELWGEETGLAKVTSDLGRTNAIVGGLSEDMKQLQVGKANVEQFETVQQEVDEMIRDALSNVAQLKQTVGTVVSDVKEHFRTATNQIAAHNASMLTEVRSSYQEELRHAAELRREIKEFMGETQRNISHLEDVVGRSQDQTESMVREVRKDVEDLNTRRKRDKQNAETESKALKQQISGVNGTGASVAKCIEHISSVVWVLLKSDRMACALSRQDDADRGKVALMGYRDSGGGEKKRERRPSSAAAEDNDIVSVDQRCLSCSGQGNAVLSGFKMACLSYAPGAVAYGKKVYPRSELMQLRTQLLEQAYEALEHGPVDFERSDIQLPKAVDEGAPQGRASSVSPSLELGSTPRGHRESESQQHRPTTRGSLAPLGTSVGARSSFIAPPLPRPPLS